MRILLIHHESQYFAGAERMLACFLEGLQDGPEKVTVAAVHYSRMAGILPASVETCWLPENAKFSLSAFYRQVRLVRHLARTNRFDVLHGWAARDWELTGLAGRITGIPALGTLHDHPQAPFLSRSRQRLMRWAAGLGLRRIVCVSGAVRAACLEAGYPSGKLAVVRNGLPPLQRRPSEANPVKAVRLGFLGQFSERKGLRGLFEMLDRLWSLGAQSWEMALAGDAQDEGGRRLIEEIKTRYGPRPWWTQVRWCGWVKQPVDFLQRLDVLICPSAEFDPFPTVLLEAGQVGLPVLAARVGGVPEIVVDGQTGWLFEAGDWAQAAATLARQTSDPTSARRAGGRARKRVEEEFTTRRMVEGYLSVYRQLLEG